MMRAVEEWVSVTSLARAIEGILETVNERNFKFYDHPEQSKESGRFFYRCPEWDRYICFRPGEQPDVARLRSEIQVYVDKAQSQPVKVGPVIPEEPGSDRTWIWVFKDWAYKVRGPYSDEQFTLMILDEFDKERQYFERLKRKHAGRG